MPVVYKDTVYIHLYLFLYTHRGWIVYRKRKHSTGAEVIYWKRKFTNGTNSSSFKRKRPLPKVEPPKGHGPFEITNWTNNPLVPGSLACVQAASGAKVIEKENEYIDAIYESTEPADEYTELS